MKHHLFQLFDFTGFNIESTSNSLMKIDNNNTIEYLHIFNGQKQEDNRFKDFYFVLQKYIFSKNKISFKNNITDGYKITNNKIIKVVNSTRIVSSFITESKIIVSFYLSNKTFIIGLFNETLDYINSTILDYFNGEDIYYYEGIFNKCIHIKKNLGAFLYYLNNNYFIPPQLKGIDIKIKDDVVVRDEKYLLSGHTLWYFIGAGKHPGIECLKSESAIFIGVDKLKIKDGVNTFVPVPEYRIIDQLIK